MGVPVNGRETRLALIQETGFNAIPGVPVGELIYLRGDTVRGSTSRVVDPTMAGNLRGQLAYKKIEPFGYILCVFTPNTDHKSLDRQVKKYETIMNDTSLALPAYVLLAVAFVIGLLIMVAASNGPYSQLNKINSALTRIDEPGFEEMLPKDKKGIYRKIIDAMIILKGRLKASDENAHKLSVMLKEREEELSKEASRADAEISELRSVIKVAEAKYGKDGITITAVGIARTPPGVIENEVIVDPKALGSAVKALLAECGIKTKKVVSSVAGQSRVVVRVIEVPKMSRDELAETMKWEVERHVPFSPAEVVMDFQPLDRPTADPDAQSMEVLLAVAQQELIDSHVQTLLAAGLKPMAIDIEPLACGRALLETATNGARDQIVAIVNIGANNTDLGIFEQGVLAFPSPPLSIAGMSFTREVSETLAQTLEEAEATKKEYASVKLDAFAAAPPIVDDDSALQSAPPAEPTQFDTVFTPGAGAATAFDLGGEPAAQKPAKRGRESNPSRMESTVSSR